jgi:hypothetical protein
VRKLGQVDLLATEQQARRARAPPAGVRGVRRRRYVAPCRMVDVVALRLANSRGPHLELLAYRTPRGRAAPDTTIRDVAADRMVLRLRDRHAAARTLPSSTLMLGATEATDFTNGPGDISLRDPDGHWLVLV